MNTSRRGFLSAAAAAGTWALARSASGAPARPTLNLGVIGVGWYGMVDAKTALKAGGVQIAAVCDVDSQHLVNSADDLEKLQGRRPYTFKHYEEMLGLKDLDAVIIGTPPHWHALQLLAALQRGLDVYCEKPIAYDIREGQAMVDAVHKAGRIVQIGFQRRQSKAFRQVQQVIDSGELGRIVQVDAQIHYTAGTLDPTPQPPPPSLDWDLWCGPAPKIPYSPQVGHMNWRLEKTTGHGHLADWGIHLIDAVRTILRLPMPKRITAAGGLYELKGKITTPDTLTVQFEFDRCPVVWRHRLWGAEEYSPETSNGVFFFGTKGTIFCNEEKWVLLRKGKGGQREEHEAKSDHGLDHMVDFLDAVRTRRQPTCLIDDAFRSTATVKLGMISYETGSAVHWDEARQQIPGNEVAVKLLQRPYRAPWKHPYQG